MSDNFDFSAIDNASASLTESGSGTETPSSTETSTPAIPTSEAPLSTLSSETTAAAPAPGGEGEMVDLGGGTKVPLSRLMEWLGNPSDQTAAESPPPAAAAPATVDPVAQLQEEVKALRQLLTQQQPAAPPQGQPQPGQQPGQPAPIDPRSHSRDWFQARNNIYRTHAKRDASEQELRADWLQACAHLDRQDFQGLQQTIRQQAQQVQVQQETNRVQQQIQGLVQTRYQNLDNDVGSTVLNWALAHAAAKGEKDMEKVVREASELIPKFIMTYAKRKQSNIRSLQGNMPRSGGTKAPSKPTFGNDIDAIDRATEALIKSGRV